MGTGQTVIKRYKSATDKARLYMIVNTVFPFLRSVSEPSLLRKALLLTQRLHTLKTWVQNPQCGHCGADRSIFTPFCPTCQWLLGIRSPLPVTTINKYPVYAATSFSAAVKQPLYAYKFYRQQLYRPLLASLLISHWSDVLSENPQLNHRLQVVTIPSRWSGNHLKPIAQQFARHFGYYYDDTLLYWQRETTPQHTLTSRQSRLQNLQYSMAAKPFHHTSTHPPSFIKRVLNKPLRSVLKPETETPTILVLDDMTTTGATFEEAFRVLSNSEYQRCTLLGFALAAVPLKQLSSSINHNVDFVAADHDFNYARLPIG